MTQPILNTPVPHWYSTEVYLTCPITKCCCFKVLMQINILLSSLVNWSSKLICMAWKLSMVLKSRYNCSVCRYPVWGAPSKLLTSIQSANRYWRQNQYIKSWQKISTHQEVNICLFTVAYTLYQKWKWKDGSHSMQSSIRLKLKFPVNGFSS